MPARCVGSSLHSRSPHCSCSPRLPRARPRRRRSATPVGLPAGSDVYAAVDSASGPQQTTALAIYPCAYFALLVLIRQRVGHTLLALRLDGVVSGLAAASLLASVSLPLAIDATAGAPFWETATGLAYTVGDLVLFGAVVSAVALSGWRIDRMWALLGGAVLAWEAADLMYLVGVTGPSGLVADALVSHHPGTALAGSWASQSPSTVD